MNTFIRAQSGTVLHGTFRTIDLLCAFGDELNHLRAVNSKFFILPENENFRVRVDNACRECTEYRVRYVRIGMPPDDYEEVTEFIFGQLTDVLEEFAPDDHYFGPHQGDGSDFGFWMLDFEDQL